MLKFLKPVKRPLGSTSESSESSESSGVIVTRGYAVGDSADLRRVVALERRDRPTDDELKQVAEDFKKELGTGLEKCECESKYNRKCCGTLLPTQAWALHEARQLNGILGPIGIGHGKTLLDLLVAMVVEVKRCAVLLVPPNLKRQLLELDWHYYGQHWKLPNLAGGKWYTPGRPLLHVVAYSELSGSKSTDLLTRVNPDVIVADEAHSLSNKNSARAKRFFRAVPDDGSVRVFAWSGTLTKRKFADWAHLARVALGQGSPAPLESPIVDEWAGHLDPGDFPSPPGKLAVFGHPVRDGYQKRVNQTPGVISSGDVLSCQASLNISERKVDVPPAIQSMLQELEDKWERPDGEVLTDAMSTARSARELSSGFYYVWRWPRREPVPVIEKWLSVRKEWRKEVRDRLKRGGEHMDSPLLVARAAIRWHNGYTAEMVDALGFAKSVQFPPKTKNGPLPTWNSEYWPAWHEVKDTAKPETTPRWVDDFLVVDACEWLEKEKGIAWYEFDAFGRAVVKKANCTFAGPGSEGDGVVLKLKGDKPLVASIRAHGTGKNMQMYYSNLVMNPPSDGAMWEQLVGRTHRQGQKSDEVQVDVYRHTTAYQNAVDKARELAEYIQGTFGATQRLVDIANWGF